MRPIIVIHNRYREDFPHGVYVLGAMHPPEGFDVTALTEPGGVISTPDPMQELWDAWTRVRCDPYDPYDSDDTEFLDWLEARGWERVEGVHSVIVGAE